MSGNQTPTIYVLEQQCFQGIFTSAVILKNMFNISAICFNLLSRLTYGCVGIVNRRVRPSATEFIVNERPPQRNNPFFGAS